MTAEEKRLQESRARKVHWKRWGPYLSERAWGTVREDYSPSGTAWEYLPHDQARSKAYRWNEDGLGGICDRQQFICFALALWNGRDPILKERLFGLTGNEGNHGEDVKEYYFYLDSTPTHSYMQYLYKYPQTEFPYARLVEENRRRGRGTLEFELLDTGVFADDRYFDVFVEYAKATSEDLLMRIQVANRGPEAAQLHLLPTLWFRNTWSWGAAADEWGSPAQPVKPVLKATPAPRGAQWAVDASHPTFGRYYLYGRHRATPLYTDNETNTERLWGQPNATPYVKDAFHRYVIHGEQNAVNPEKTGTKFAAHHVLAVDPGQSVNVGLTLSARALESPFAKREVI
ncbi:MAG: MGH1-like glycoside hydrolase domain-containing protein, partial [Candidatus Binatia bacterium]